MKAILHLALILLFGCGSIPKDLTPAPIDNNLFTAEMAACGRRDIGLLGCNFDKTSDLKNLFFEIPLIRKGEYIITSKKCNFNENKTYSRTEILKISFADLLAGKPEDENVCNFDVKIFIDGLDKGFRGIFSLVDKSKFKPATVEFWSGRNLASFQGVGGAQLRAGISKDHYLKFITETPGTIVWFGCDTDGEKKYKSNPTLSLHELFIGALIEAKSCIIEAGLIPDDIKKKPEIFTFNIQIFSALIVQLPDPTLKLKHNGRFLKVEADAAVAVIIINNKYKILTGTNAKAFTTRVVQGKEVWVRISTANGRTNLYKILNGEIIWKSLIRY
jgi:hypothetical protein